MSNALQSEFHKERDLSLGNIKLIRYIKLQGRSQLQPVKVILFLSNDFSEIICYFNPNKFYPSLSKSWLKQIVLSAFQKILSESVQGRIYKVLMDSWNFHVKKVFLLQSSEKN